MKITRIDVQTLTLPLHEPTVMAAVTLEQIDSVLVSITLDNGIIGYGEAGMGPTLYADTVESTVSLVRNYFAPALTGQDIEGLDRLSALMDKVKQHGNPCARGAVDLALHDALGKLYGVPVATLLGGPHRTSCEMVGWIGLSTAEKQAEKARTLAEAGHTWFKLKIDGHVAEDIRRVAAVREVIGDARLRIDAGAAYTPPDALRFAHRLADYDIEVLEDPVPEEAWFAFTGMRGKWPVPISADGVIRSPREAARIISGGCADMIKVKLIRAGGLTQAHKIVQLAELFDMPVIVGRSTTGDVETAAQLHLACSARSTHGGGEFLGSAKASSHIVTEPLTVTDGTMTLPDRPGLGFEIDDDALRRHSTPLPSIS